MAMGHGRQFDRPGGPVCYFIAENIDDTHNTSVTGNPAPVRTSPCEAVQIAACRKPAEQSEWPDEARILPGAVCSGTEKLRKNSGKEPLNLRGGRKMTFAKSNTGYSCVPADR